MKDAAIGVSRKVAGREFPGLSALAMAARKVSACGRLRNAAVCEPPGTGAMTGARPRSRRSPGVIDPGVPGLRQAGDLCFAAVRGEFIQMAEVAAMKGAGFVIRWG